MCCYGFSIVIALVFAFNAFDALCVLRDIRDSDVRTSCEFLSLKKDLDVCHLRFVMMSTATRF